MAFQEASGWCGRCRNVLVRRDRANHVLHLLLTLITGGLWVIVWIGVAIRFGGWRCTRCGKAARCSGGGLAGALMFVIATVVLVAGVSGLVAGVQAIREKRRAESVRHADDVPAIDGDPDTRVGEPGIGGPPSGPPETSAAPPTVLGAEAAPPVAPPEPPIANAEPTVKPHKKAVLSAEERLEGDCRDWFSAAKGYRQSGLVELATKHLQKVIDNSKDAQLISEAKRLKDEISAAGR